MLLLGESVYPHPVPARLPGCLPRHSGASIVRSPWFYGWNIVAIGMAWQAMTFGIALYCFTFWIPLWMAEFNVGRGDVLALFFAIQISMGLLAPFSGRAMDTMSIRLLVCVGLVGFASALAFSALATSLMGVAIAFCTLGILGPLLAGPLAAQTLITRWFVERRGLALGISTVGTSIGGLLLPPLVTSLQAAVGWRDTNFVMAAFLVLVLTPLVLVLVREPKAAVGATNEQEATPALPSLSTSQILRHRVFWGVCLAFVPLSLALGAVQQNIAPLSADAGIDAVQASLLVSIMAFVMIGAKLVFGALADTTDHRWLFLGSIVSAGAALVLLQLPGLDFAALVVVSACLGVAGGGLLPLLGSVISGRLGTASFGRVMGLLGPFTILAAAGPWFAGEVRDATNSYADAWFYLCFVLPVSAAALILLSPPRTSEAVAT